MIKIFRADSTMSAITFDTLSFANRLKAAGCDAHLAEEQAALQAEIFDHLIKNTLVTKEDFKNLAAETKEDMKKLAAETKGDIQRLEKEIQRVEHKVDMLGTTLLFKLGTLMVVLTGIMGTVLGILIKTG